MQRYFAKNIENNKVKLLDSDYHHIKNVMRYKNNDKIEVEFNQKLYIASINDINTNDIEIISNISSNNELDIDICIAVGLVKEQKMDLILQKLTELGVKKIIPLKLNRCIVKIDDNKIDKKLTRWNSICKEASEQSKRNIIPTVLKPMSINELLKEDYDLKLVASTKEENLISNYLQNVNKCGKIIVVIGPEGGIEPTEEDFLNKNGFISVSFGDLILRVETASIYVASIINYSCRK